MCFTGDRIRLHVGGLHQLSIHTINAQWCAAAAAQLSWELRFSEQGRKTQHLHKLSVSWGKKRREKSQTDDTQREPFKEIQSWAAISSSCFRALKWKMLGTTSQRIQLRISTAQQENIWLMHHISQQIMNKHLRHCQSKSVPSISPVERYTVKNVQHLCLSYLFTIVLRTRSTIISAVSHSWWCVRAKRLQITNRLTHLVCWIFHPVTSRCHPSCQSPTEGSLGWS